MIIANCLLCVCATLLGVTGFIIADAAIRRSFLKTKQSLSIYIEMEEGSKQQESLLLSVLPTHVAREMVKDLDKNVTSQFRKIYMNRHENVSILFADIVGFTAMSSTVTAAELIIILNDLFATFDKLAHKYHQLRIKILGDCYYCICGCPSPRADHAVLCIHMGLAMVDAIKGVQEKTQSGVNMRVGVHTGAVLGGVLGQVRWQYDVLGKEVTLANKMESGGLPGRVHISATTASFLRGEFSLEPGDGASREEGIKMANMTTFLIKGVLKKYPQGTLDDPALKKDKRDKKSKRGKRSPRPPPRETLHEVTHIPEMPDAQSKERLYRALMDRENNTLIYKELHKISMNFENKEMEAQYAKQRQVIGGHALVMASLVAILTSAAQFLVLPRDLLTTTTFAVGTALLINMTIISLPPSFPKHFPPFMIKMSKNIEASKCLLLIWVVSAVLILALTTSVQIIVCDTSVGSELNDTVNATVNESVISSSTTNSEKCYYPTYYIDSGVLVMLLITLITPLSFLIKNAMTSLLCVLYCLLANIFYEKPFNDFDDVLLNQIRNHDGFVSTKYATTITIVCIAVFLLHYSRYFDRLSRKLYYYHHEVEEMQHQLEDLKAKNQKLIFNILPPYVAKDFIGKLKEDEELYSQSYGLVGVMFAACPNFHDFYTEVAVNNNGLECFRVLNEIISDYDDLLNESRFQTIVKIKTIGPTFMAASGMTEDAFCVGKNKWAHLRDLVEFAFAMKECLQRINTQSFNNFMLRIGINQGPILAGVIGAKKPHYDIWGNTVNVASRMESTGQLGKIQVVEETMLILKEFGYKFEPRGFVMVKGKGNLMTYFLTGKDSASALSSTLLPNQINDFHANDMKITT